MRIVGCLVWADEDPQWLMAAVTALAPLLDHLVALDGRYMLYPGALSQAASSIDQSRAILEAAAACHLGVTLHRPEAAYVGNEVEKRQLGVRLAQLAKESDDDWMVVFDADMVARKFEPAYIRNDLAGSDHLVAQYGLIEDPGSDGITAVRAIYRLTEGLEYGPAHYCVSAPASDGTRVWLWGNPGIHRPYVEALNLTGVLQFDHRNTNRTLARTERAREYYRKRDMLGVESFGETFVQNLDGDWTPIRRDAA